MKKWINLHVVVIILLIIATITFVFGFNSVEDWVYEVWPYQVGMRATYDLPAITFQFLKIAIIASVSSIVLGVFLGILASTRIGSNYRFIVEKLAMIAQSIPAMAILMFGLAAFGIGLKAAVFALLMQSLLPTVFSTMAGLENVPKSYVDVGRGLGMTPMQVLFKVQMPLALPVILSGARTAVIICISSATLAFSTGAGGLGLLIQNGASTYNSVYIFEGTVPIALIAIIADQILREFEKRAYRV
jgi:osmoprotectant transport system permease protein